MAEKKAPTLPEYIPAKPSARKERRGDRTRSNKLKAGEEPAIKPPATKKPPARTKNRGLATRNDADLTVEQEAYCRCRAMGMSQEEAIAKAEINRTINTVRKWESANPKVRARIGELSQIATDRAIERTGLTREWVIDKLQTMVERCMQAEPVYQMVDGERVETGEYQFDSSGANQALRMLGDTLGMFKPKPPAPGEDLAELSDDEVARIAAELAAQTGLAGIIAGTETPSG